MHKLMRPVRLTMVKPVGHFYPIPSAFSAAASGSE